MPNMLDWFLIKDIKAVKSKQSITSTSNLTKSQLNQDGLHPKSSLCLDSEWHLIENLWRHPITPPPPPTPYQRLLGDHNCNQNQQRLNLHRQSL